jgi:hypothetical protein
MEAMQKLVVGVVMAAVLAVVGFLMAPHTSAQAAGACPSGFKLIQTSGGDSEDVDTDGYVCEQRTTQSDTIVTSFRVDNSGSVCPGSSSGTPLAPNGPFVPVFNPPGVKPDRNCNAVVCMKAFFTNNMGFHQVVIDDKGPGGVCP